VKVALAGLPLSGKTCLFDALSEGAVDSALHPARADHPNVASVAVPDRRLDWLYEHYKPPKQVPVHVELLDLPGLTPGRSDLATQNTAVLEHLRRADALVYVLRAFDSPRVPGRVDPKADRDVLDGEFLISDLDVVLRRIEKIEGQIAKPLPHREALKHELEFLTRCRVALEAEKPLHDVAQTDAERGILHNFAALTEKPVVTVLNVGEGHASRPLEAAKAYEGLPQPLIALCASLEAEISQLPADERAVFMEEMGLDRIHALDLLPALHRAQHRITFYTTGDKEVAARSLPQGATAVDAAADVHTDMAHGFIRAEVVTFDHLKSAGNVKQARADGHVRLEGRDYVVQDGDIILFHFSR